MVLFMALLVPERIFWMPLEGIEEGLPKLGNFF